MEKALTATHILAPLFIGLIIGGFAFGNTGAGILGIVLLVIDSAVGITLQYRAEKPYREIEREVEKAYIGFEIFEKKLNHITSNHACFEEFTLKEPATGIVNLADARENLSATEYSNVMKIYNHYEKSQTKFLLNFEKYLSLCDEIISNYDLAAPYYKYCGYEALFGKLADDEKKPFRDKAADLLARNLQFTASWTELQKEFAQRFYG